MYSGRGVKPYLSVVIGQPRFTNALNVGNVLYILES